MDDLAVWVRWPEGQFFERKSLFHGPPESRAPRGRREVRDQIAECVAAFANADGGTLIMGVEDDGTPSGHGYPNEAIEEMLNVPRRRLRPPQPAGARARLGDHEILVFKVPAAEGAVQVTGGGFPRRVHDQVIQESELNIKAIKERERLEGRESQLVHGVGMDALDSAVISRVRRSAGLSCEDDQQYLLHRGLADTREGRLVVRWGALLLFARSGGDIGHPNAGVRIFKVGGCERRTGREHNVREHARIEGALPYVIESAYAVLGRLIGKSARLHSLFFRETPEYPTFAWQEGLINAVAHRDYGITGRGVEIWLFDDRMEIVSPGPPPPEVDIESLRRRQPVHCSRNPRVTRVLAELSLMREQGEGIPRIFDEMERSYLVLPEIRIENGSFKLTLSNRPIFDVPDPEWVRRVDLLAVTQRQRRALVAYARASFTNADYQKLNDIDRDTAYREIKELLDRGILSRGGTSSRGRGARYFVTLEAEDKPPLTPRQMLLRRMTTVGFLRNADLQRAFGIDGRHAYSLLKKLVASGVLVLEGERRGSRYMPGEAWSSWANGFETSDNL